MQLTDSGRGPVKCPRCHSVDGVPIRYGFPGDEMLAAAKRGQIVLGGCCTYGGLEPIWFCRTCRAQWDAEGVVWDDEDEG